MQTSRIKLIPSFSRAEWLLFAVFLVQWFLLASLALPTWDGVYYYAFPRSIVFDGDWHFADDIQVSFPTSGDHFPTRGFDQEIPETGMVGNPFGPLAGFTWLPWIVVARVGGLVFDSTEITGYEWYFVRVMGVMTALVGLLAFMLAFRFLKGIFGRNIALATTLTLMFTTPILHYQFRNPFYSHPISALSVVLVIAYWWQNKDKRSLKSAWILGILIGLSTLIRSQHVTYFVIPLVATMLWWWQQNDKPKATFDSLRYLLVCGLGVTLIVSIQLATWQLLYGTAITVPQGDSFMTWDFFNLIPTLFSPFRGLLTWMPMMIPATVGLILLARKTPQLAVPLILALFLSIYITASSGDWFGGGGFGPRRFSSEMMIFAVGYGTILQTIAVRWRWPAATILGLLLGWHHWTLMRFGVVNQVGGRVVSMYPNFEWLETSWGEFGRTVWHYATQAITPSYWIFNGSPLHMLQSEDAILQHLFGLFMALLIFWCGWLLIYPFRQAERKRIPTPNIYIFPILCVALINLWILFLA